MSTNILPRTLALTLAFGFTPAAMLAPAHATDGRTAAQMCVDRDDCTITPGANGSFTLTLDGGGVIWCPDVNGECVVVSPDTGKVGQAPVAVPITKTPVAAAPGNPVTKTPGCRSAIIPRHPSRSVRRRSCFTRSRFTTSRSCFTRSPFTASQSCFILSTTNRSACPPLRSSSCAAAGTNGEVKPAAH